MDARDAVARGESHPPPGEPALPSGLVPLWQRAAILGSLWAASEIVLGSFLHNLRAPFAGHLLTGIAIVVLVAGHRTWPQPGLLARAGLIAAVMKSASPSAVLFGPMVAIVMEGLALEVGVRLAAGRRAGYLLGGALAMSWTLLHKLGSFLLTYGLDVIRVYGDLVAWAERQIGTIPLGAWGPVVALVLLNLVAGAAAAVVGVRLGASRQAVAPARRIGAEVAGWRRRVGPVAMPLQTPSLVALATWAAALPLGLFAFTRAGLLLKFALAGLAVLAAVVRSRRSLRRLGRPGFWLSLVAMTVLAGAVVGGLSTRPDASWVTGLAAGVGMSLHAVFVTICFAALGSELTHPWVRSRLGSIAGGQPHRAVQAAFATLPLVIAALPPGRELLRRPGAALGGLLPHLDDWLAARGSGGRLVGIVTGERGQGKTAFTAKLVSRLRGRGLRVAGVLAPGEIRGGVRWSIDLVDLTSGRRSPLATRDPASAWPEVGSFRVDPDSLERGRAALSPEAAATADLVVVDEVGPWELAGQGWAGALEALRSASAPLLLVVRSSLVDEVLARFAPMGAAVWDVGSTTVDDVADTIRGQV